MRGLMVAAMLWAGMAHAEDYESRWPATPGVKVQIAMSEEAKSSWEVWQVLRGVMDGSDKRKVIVVLDSRGRTHTLRIY